MTHVLDTHAVIWLIEDSPRLSVAAGAVLDDPASKLVVPTIVMAELWHLYHRKRVAFSPEEIRSRLQASANCKLYPLDDLVLDRLPPGLEIHDAIIVATAIVQRDVFQQQVRLITLDAAIVESKLIETLW